MGFRLWTTLTTRMSVEERGVYCRRVWKKEGCGNKRGTKRRLGEGRAEDDCFASRHKSQVV